MPAEPEAHGAHAVGPDDLPAADGAPTRESAAGRVPQRLAQAALKDLPWRSASPSPTRS